MTESPVEEAVEDLKNAQNIRIEQQFSILQRHRKWNEYKSCSKQPKTYPPRHHPVNASQFLLQNSPKNLMASIQRPGMLSSSSTWKVRNNLLAVEEIRRERKAAIESGKLNGRRLSYDEALDIGLDLKEEVFTWNCWGDGIVEERDEVMRSMSSTESEKECGENSSNEGKGVAVCLHCVSYSSASSSAGSCFQSGKNMEEEISSLNVKRESVDNANGNWREIGFGRRREYGAVLVTIVAAFVTFMMSLRSLGFASYYYMEDHFVPT